MSWVHFLVAGHVRVGRRVQSRDGSGDEAKDRLSQEQIQVSWEGSRFSGVPNPVGVADTAGGGGMRTVGVSAQQSLEGRQLLVESSRVHEGGVFLPVGSKHALGKGHGFAADTRLELDHLGHLPEGRMISVHEQVVLSRVPSIRRILDQDL
jgi:hypothetical protein